MRICLYTSTALPKIGGQEMAVDALARQYQQQGCEVVVLAPHPRRPLRERDSELPYRVARHPRLISTRYLVDAYAWWLRRLHRQVRFDVVHCQGVYPHGYLAVRSRPRLGVPVVVTSQSDDGSEDNHRLQCPLIRPRIAHALQHADHLIAISTFAHEGYLRMGADPARITFIPNGADAARLAAPAPRPADLPACIQPGRYFLFLGRLAARKGVDVLLSAMARIPSEQGVELVIAGAGEEREGLEALAQKLNLTQRVCFVGAVQSDKKSYLLQNARCLVAPTRTWEGCPLVVLEGFAAGAPVVATNIKGMTDLVEPGRTGCLVGPEDVAALAEALATVRACPTLEEMRGRVRARARGYDWSVLARRHIELFEQLIGTHDARARAG